ncbi:MAG TPA: hypothetical protein VM142_05890 [Acidimicrobiales bacterium]|nr:hypothetical protein [Acidimicrobiales bacterium]
MPEPEKGLPSIDALLAAVERQHDQQRTHFEGLDSKAGIALGFAGAIAALAKDVQPGLAKIGVSLSILAAFLALMSIRPRKLPIFDPLALRRYLRANEEFTKLRLLDTQIEMALRTSRLIETKAFWLQVSLATLVLSVALMVGGTLLR